jgi:hypothetical protein
VSGQLHAPDALPLGKELPLPIGSQAGWAPEPVWTTWRRESSWPYRDSNTDPSVVQSVVSRYTDYAPITTNNIIVFRRYNCLIYLQKLLRNNRVCSIVWNEVVKNVWQFIPNLIILTNRINYFIPFLSEDWSPPSDIFPQRDNHLPAAESVVQTQITYLAEGPVSHEKCFDILVLIDKSLCYLIPLFWLHM